MRRGKVIMTDGARGGVGLDGEGVGEVTSRGFVSPPSEAVSVRPRGRRLLAPSPAHGEKEPASLPSGVQAPLQASAGLGANHGRLFARRFGYHFAFCLLMSASDLVLPAGDMAPVLMANFRPLRFMCRAKRTWDFLGGLVSAPTAVDLVWPPTGTETSKQPGVVTWLHAAPTSLGSHRRALKPQDHYKLGIFGLPGTETAHPSPERARQGEPACETVRGRPGVKPGAPSGTVRQRLDNL
ncbi:hypothetical protein GGTG_03596 [Gaeumannomyces tritici R3-111a-1]|uniref:Uncharacterized protein n=1 Tax=Gaeumannomyces tritici (strain R3-111a-1) TaxID=644352 RepID=J3NQP0_GAET3|nr:hypothetical protein GGTG_03596 [Gaeumannomyces tritici R3-111a-1]EJT78496.1 hypothetical protein GGTG_03596 [Gaeumannomyces tritici R3-111a-1]